MIRDLPEYSQNQTRKIIRESAVEDEQIVLQRLRQKALLAPASEARVWQHAYDLVNRIREKQRGQGGIDALLQEFSLSSDEGIVLMCLAESLLRIPDNATQDRMIRDRLSSGDWSSHLGNSDSLFVNASAWGLLLTGKVTGLTNFRNTNMLERTVSRLGEPVIRSAMRIAMQIMGDQFVMGRHIEEAMKRARS